METYAQDVINKLELGEKGLDIEEQKLVKDIVLGMLEIASKGAGAALGAKVVGDNVRKRTLIPHTSYGRKQGTFGPCAIR